MLVVGSPYVGATVLGRLLGELDLYDVVVPDIGAGEEVPSIHFDAVLTTLPVPDHSARVVIELPWDWETPVQLTVDQVKRELQISGPDPIAEVLALLHRCVSKIGPSDSRVMATHGVASSTPACGHGEQQEKYG